MRRIWMLAMVALLLGCAPATLSPDLSFQGMGQGMGPVQVVGPENHALVLDGLS